MHRFFVPKEAINDGQAAIRGEELSHLSKVLRLTVGDPLAIFDGKGHEYQGKIKALTKDEAVVQVTESLPVSTESSLEVWLVQGIPKGEKMELVIQKATELGVRGIIPLKTERCVVKLAGAKEEERRKRWQKVAIEAAKQCGRALVPEVLSPCSIGSFLASIPKERYLFVPWEEGGLSIKAVLSEEKPQQAQTSSRPVFLVIGPEGGLAASEVNDLKKNGGIPLTLGPRILRTETAGLAAIAVVMFAWGDLG